MADPRDLLVEIGTEELPPKALGGLSRAFSDGLARALRDAGLPFDDVRGFASPRRLAVLISGLASAQPERRNERRGPALQAAFDGDGKPTRAAEGFARSCGVTVEQLETLETDKGRWLVFRQTQPGQPTTALVPGAVEKALAALPIPKRMRWGSGDVEFVRPVHWVVLLFGDQVVDCRILGIEAGRHTRGHRFHHPAPLELAEAGDYLSRLREEGYVYADLEERRGLIQQQLEILAGREGATVTIDADLLDEVTALVEWPVALMGSFDARFLELPAEVLIKAMQDHQKYFPLTDPDGRLLALFITVSNIESRDPEQVRSGNERVIRPRFSDARFFWEQDLRSPLESHLEPLKAVVYQEKLGSLYDKVGRIGTTATRIADTLQWDGGPVARAALLCKCDLLTNMVGEFPGLQGTMGRYYAERSGEVAEVSTALEEHYLPRHAGDGLPATHSGLAVAIADRLDTLVGIFAIGQKPTGVKDPFGLRRAALGVLRIMIETPLDLDLREMLESSASALADRCDAADAVDGVYGYMMERLKAYYHDRHISGDVIESVLARNPTRPLDFDRRVRAVTAFRALPESASLAAANKRIRNLLRRTEEAYPDRPESAFLSQSAEQELAQRLGEFADEVAPMLQRRDYTQALTRLAGLREPVDRFFDEVMVMCDDAAQRKNRLALLANLEGLFLRVADLSRLH